MRNEGTRLAFTKMHGCGNDYIYIDCLEREISAPEQLAVVLSDRHFGIGGDGLVLICRSDIADAKMRMFNLDGSEGKMCGNAIRCVAKYLYDNDICKKDEIKIETLSGVKTLQVYAENGFATSVKVDMGKAELTPSRIPVALPGDRIVNAPLAIQGKTYGITCVSMGNPHAVVFCQDVDSLNLAEIGPRFEHHEIFPERVNTEFAQVIDQNTLKMRVWERGSGETLACGTGACAAAVASVLNGYCAKGQDIRVLLTGGELIINYTDERVLMTGGCVKVFEGVVEL
ncbi:MAG TPA: diaminopimelate epimerase [Clostridiales bacterium]|nr:diaminopimelate epimerase [Clostridiales bacterium]